MFIPRYPVNIDIVYHDGIPAWTDTAELIHKQGAWLNNALVLDVYNSKAANLRALRNRLFDEIRWSFTKPINPSTAVKKPLKWRL
jgi:hypothetical protein